MEVLFVCTGNTCRSPLAEVCFNAAARAAGRGECVAHSAGIAACDGSPASVNAQLAAGEVGLDLKSFRSRRLTPELVRGADWIICMSDSHARSVRRMAPEAADKIRLLSADGNGVDDPFGGDPARYRACRDEIAAATERLIQEL